MGFTAIQISPVVHNIENDTIVGDAYHGYWQDDLYAVNQHFGTADELQKLSDELHNRDMYFLVDVVVNNMAQAFNNTYPPPIDYSLIDPFNKEDYYHSYCNVTQWTNVTNYQDCWLYPLGVALADLDTESDTVVDMFGTWIKELVSNYTIDGIRIDAAKHVNSDFLPTFVSNSGVFALGEVLTGEVDDFCPYQADGLLPGMPNYLEYYKILEAFNGGEMSEISAVREQARDSCNDTAALGSFTENHDMPRFASYNDDMALAKNAMAYIILNDGIPLGTYHACDVAQRRVPKLTSRVCSLPRPRAALQGRRDAAEPRAHVALGIQHLGRAVPDRPDAQQGPQPHDQPDGLG